jgi:hypothetical protein
LIIKEKKGKPQILTRLMTATSKATHQTHMKSVSAKSAWWLSFDCSSFEQSEEISPLLL